MPEYRTEPLVVPVCSGLLPEGERNRRVALTSFSGKLAERPCVPECDVTCYECGRRTQVPSAALSSRCTHCHAHLRMTDVVLRHGAQRLTVRTLGDVTVQADAQLSQLSVVCRHCYLEGRGSGSFRCEGTLRIACSNRIDGSVQVGTLVVERGKELILTQGAAVDVLEVYGKVTGRIVARTRVVLHRGAELHGNCFAPALELAAGAKHRGEWSRSANV